MTTVDEFASRFSDEPGYLDFGRIGPLATSVLDEIQVQTELLARARFGSLAHLEEQDQRVRDAVSALTGFPSDHVVFQPNASSGLMHAMFGLTGGVLLSAAEFPSLTFAAVRASEHLGVVTPLWLETDHGRVTPGQIRDQITPTTAAVAVSLVDSRTGYLADIEGIRQVIGDRLLIVDAIQGFGVVDAPYEVADVVVSGGQKWTRAGWGTGFMALSDRALEQLDPVISGFSATDVEGTPFDDVPPPSHSARAFSISNPDRVAQARFAAALEEIHSVGVADIQADIAERVSRVIDLADEFALTVTSSRDESERAGLVVLEPPTGQLTVLAASLFNHGITATTRTSSVRLSVHVSTGQDTLDMLQAALTSFATASNY
ncbi:aminotransferase class V-fold PLP-dependent enzyme [Compostimonas suwonensis]|uniref:Selenocysteine lyase/cysteine desulfurase n=1 Tax=Compostimonas suwonensis TaxID=1048394 RepID=A0A2M9BW89_9MICO|nr:aminotransferase class V-fold PLP-dependent enzyme [Compostimonas suwonensis]PJJ62216.1 selenocysteine lyase/cysteine desulfurase [Compostimonas suwonensis]